MTQLVRGAWGPYLSMLEGDGIHIRPWDAWPRDIDAITLYPKVAMFTLYRCRMENT